MRSADCLRARLVERSRLRRGGPRDTSSACSPGTMSPRTTGSSSTARGELIPVELRLARMPSDQQQAVARDDPRSARAAAHRGDSPARRRARAAEPPHPGGQPAQERVPREHVARAAHAAQRDHRVRRADARRPGRSRLAAAQGVPRRHPDERPPPAAADQRRARSREGRGRQARVPARADRARASWSARSSRSCAPPSAKQARSRSSIEVDPSVDRASCSIRPAQAGRSTTTCRTRSSSRPTAAASSCACSPRATTAFRLEVEDTGIGIAPERSRPAVRRVPAARGRRRASATRAPGSASR